MPTFGECRIVESAVARPLLLLGRHALLVYVAHLVLLGLLDLAGLTPPNALWTLAEVAALATACVGIARAAHWRRVRRRWSRVGREGQAARQLGT
ncbi:MAG: OpgC domain-containing protein [Polyangiaceae bacterium]|nr:OpgC domain-containing protein [Polyangiaceae bacterium]